jgi:hypothetical protein
MSRCEALSSDPFGAKAFLLAVGRMIEWSEASLLGQWAVMTGSVGAHAPAPLSFLTGHFSFRFSSFFFFAFLWGKGKIFIIRETEKARRIRTDEHERISWVVPFRHYPIRSLTTFQFLRCQSNARFTSPAPWKSWAKRELHFPTLCGFLIIMWENLLFWLSLSAFAFPSWVDETADGKTTHSASLCYAVCSHPFIPTSSRALTNLI